MTYLPETRRQLLAAAERRAARRNPSLPRLRLGWVLPIVSLTVAAAVALAFLGVGSQSAFLAANPWSHPMQIVYQAEPTPQVPAITRAALEQTVQKMQRRLREIPHSRASVRILSGHRIGVDLASGVSRSWAERLLQGFQIEFYDWEVNVLLPNGKPATTQPRSAPPVLSLYSAVKLASRQPYAPSKLNSRAGSEYYLFTRGGRLLAGPLDPGPQTSRAQAVNELRTGSPRGGQVLVVKQGTVVVEAAPKLFRVANVFGAPHTGYYVLRDHVALFGNQITHPRAGIDSSGAPDVEFDFTAQGAAEFHDLTADVARRGALQSSGAERLFQHFAVALNNQLITTAEVDYTVYPDGITGSVADVTGPFIRSSADGLARAMQAGALPVQLKLVR